MEMRLMGPVGWISALISLGLLCSCDAYGDVRKWTKTDANPCGNGALHWTSFRGEHFCYATTHIGECHNDVQAYMQLLNQRCGELDVEVNGTKFPMRPVSVLSGEELEFIETELPRHEPKLLGVMALSVRERAGRDGGLQLVWAADPAIDAAFINRQYPELQSLTLNRNRLYYFSIPSSDFKVAENMSCTGPSRRQPLVKYAVCKVALKVAETGEWKSGDEAAVEIPRQEANPNAGAVVDGAVSQDDSAKSQNKTTQAAAGTDSVTKIPQRLRKKKIRTPGFVPRTRPPAEEENEEEKRSTERSRPTGTIITTTLMPKLHWADFAGPRFETDQPETTTFKPVFNPDGVIWVNVSNMSAEWENMKPGQPTFQVLGIGLTNAPDDDDYYWVNYTDENGTLRSYRKRRTTPAPDLYDIFWYTYENGTYYAVRRLKTTTAATTTPRTRNPDYIYYDITDENGTVIGERKVRRTTSTTTAEAITELTTTKRRARGPFDPGAFAAGDHWLRPIPRKDNIEYGADLGTRAMAAWRVSMVSMLVVAFAHGQF